jgi:hypothetical protein
VALCILALQGSIRFVDDGRTECWIYRQEKPLDETCFDRMGRLSEPLLFAGTLWVELEGLLKADACAGVPPLKVRLLRRTGSF